MTDLDLTFLKEREITVLKGGWSAERDISLKTGSAVEDSLNSLGLKVIGVDLKSPEDIDKHIDSLDLVFIALHGRGGEDGFVQKVLEENKIQFTGSSSKSCELSMNKSETKKVWRDFSLPTPDFVEIRNAGTPQFETIPFLSNEADISPLEQSFVVKPAREGSSLGISIIHPEEEISLEEAMKIALEFDDILLVEAFVEGEEITIPVLGEETLPPISITPSNKFYDFEAKYLKSDTVYEKSDLSSEELSIVNDFALNAFSCLGCNGWGRIDLIKDKNNNFQLIEINTVPGLTETSLVPKSASLIDMDFHQLVTAILNTA